MDYDIFFSYPHKDAEEVKQILQDGIFLMTLLELGDNAQAIDILKRDLLWLINLDPATLEANQQQIREMMIQMIGQKDQSE